jgi:hypothetical protein
MSAEADFVESVTDVAVTVTCFPEGTEVGAIKVVLTPLAVLLDPKEPQLPEGAQLQFTPPLAESLLTLAATEVTAVTPIVEGGDGARATAIDAGGTLVVGACPVPPPQAIELATDNDRIRKAIFEGVSPGNTEDTSTSLG